MKYLKGYFIECCIMLTVISMVNTLPAQVVPPDQVPVEPQATKGGTKSMTINVNKLRQTIKAQTKKAEAKINKAVGPVSKIGVPINKAGEAIKRAGTSNMKMKSSKPKSMNLNKFRNIYALIEVEGLPSKKVETIKFRLFHLRVPRTVRNFIDLAEGHIKTPQRTLVKGTNQVKVSNKLVLQEFYNGLIFHRVIPGFMIQGGCPLGNGRGDPGYTFADEPSCDLKHNKPGVLSMANSGPNTNGSQFFITLAPAAYLDLMDDQCKKKGRGHTVFGEIAEGMDVVKKIASMKRNMQNDKPLNEIKIKSIKIIKK